MIGGVVMDAELLNELISVILKRVPGFKIKYKDQSFWQKIIGLICFFNRSYLTSYTSTFGYTVYFPSKKFVEENYKRAFKILAHEYVHLLDRKKHPIIFEILYASPQVLVIFSLLSVLALFFSNWFLLFLLFLEFALPMPSLGRAVIEIRGYAMNLAINMWKHGSITSETIADVSEKFTGWDYYKMWPNKKSVEKWIREYIARVRNIDSAKRDNDTILDDSEAYSDVYDLLTGIEGDEGN